MFIYKPLNDILLRQQNPPTRIITQVYKRIWSPSSRPRKSNSKAPQMFSQSIILDRVCWFYFCHPFVMYSNENLPSCCYACINITNWLIVKVRVSGEQRAACHRKSEGNQLQGRLSSHDGPKLKDVHRLSMSNCRCKMYVRDMPTIWQAHFMDRPSWTLHQPY